MLAFACIVARRVVQFRPLSVRVCSRLCAFARVPINLPFHLLPSHSLLDPPRLHVICMSGGLYSARLHSCGIAQRAVDCAQPGYAYVSRSVCEDVPRSRAR